MTLDYVPPLGNLRVVSGEDPAIDAALTGGKNLGQYMRVRDLSVLTFKPGARPVYYTLREMPDLAYSWVEEAPSLPEKLIRVLEACLVSIENATDAKGDQRPGIYTLETMEQAHLGCSLAGRAQFLPLIQPRGVRWELGHLAHWRSELHPKARCACEMLPGSLRRISARFSDAETIAQLQAIRQAQQKHDETQELPGNATATESDSTVPATP